MQGSSRTRGTLRRYRAWVVAVSMVLAGAEAPAVAGAGAVLPEVRVGERIENFTLRDLGGKPHRLTDYADKKAVVLAFNGVGCPISKLYAPRIQRIYERYAGKGVQVLGINANRQDDVRELRAFANTYRITFPILKDHDNQVADQLGALRTTEVYILDASRVLRYHGRLDDQYGLSNRSVGVKKDRAEVNYVTDALDALIAGREIKITKTTMPGCVIGRRGKRKEGSRVTFHEHVEPIIQRRCQTCHREGEIGPFPLMDYEDVAGWSGMIREVIVNRRMPPWHADPNIGTFSNDRSLSPAERDALVAWIDGGTPAGDAAQAPPPREWTRGWSIGEPDVVYALPRSFRVPAEGVVDYQWCTVQTNFKVDRWVQAAEIRPGARAVVHHILTFAVDPKHPDRWQRETRGGERGFFIGMVPGGEAIVYPDGMAKRLPAGATLVFQIHYTPNGKAQRDRSKIGFVFARKPVRHEVYTRSAYNKHTLYIPPRTEAKEVRAAYRFRRPAKLLGMLPHMHLRGQSFRYEAHYPARVRISAEPPWDKVPAEAMPRMRFDAQDSTLVFAGAMSDAVYEQLAALYERSEDKKAIAALREQGRSEVLLSVPAYDFGWQSAYQLAEPKFMPAGTLLLCTATFNNSSSNPGLTREMWNQPVRWGEQTFDEMLIGYFDFIEVDDR